MSDTLSELYTKWRALQEDIRRELEAKQRRFAYRFERARVVFDQAAVEAQRAHLLGLFRYLVGARPRHFLTAPVIYSVIVPAVLLDFWVSLYHGICFPVWGIPKVRRGDYIVIDRHYLPYLNLLEKLNCVYCGYFNGLIAYVQEIAARTEQYWCPIKHAKKLKTIHSRYPVFLDYGDAKAYREKLPVLRHDFT